MFVDIDPNTLVMSFEDLKKKYSKDCVAVIPVHVGGHPSEMEKIVPWARKNNLDLCGKTYIVQGFGNVGSNTAILLSQLGMICFNLTF